MKLAPPSNTDRKNVRRSTPANNTIEITGKYGIGDACWALNVAHNTAKILSVPIELSVHWNWDRNYYYSYDDVENIIDQMDYIKNFYDNPQSVNVVHNINSNKADLHDINGRMLNGPDPAYRSLRQSNWWKFNQALKLPTIENKVVIWRSSFNFGPLPDSSKEMVNNEDWNHMISKLQSNGYTVVELSYRTPIREAMYHINTCSSTIGYAGMWYYFANNWQKPCLIVSKRSITRVHMPACLEIADRKMILSICDNYDQCEEMIDLYCAQRYNYVNKWISNL